MVVPNEGIKNTNGKKVGKDVEWINDKIGTIRSQTRYKQSLILLGSLLVLLLVVIVVWMIVFLIKYESPIINNYFMVQKIPDSFSSLEITTEEGISADQYLNHTLPGNLNFISRNKWMAHTPKQRFVPLQAPVHYIIISHTATENCSDIPEYTLQVQLIQKYHQHNRNWNDIGYNFLVGGDGNVYEARGWEYVGAHNYGFNKSIGIAIMGYFSEILPSERQIIVTQQLIEEGVKLGYVAENYKLLAARQVHATESPGLKLYQNMKTWPHWAEKV